MSSTRYRAIAVAAIAVITAALLAGLGNRTSPHKPRMIPLSRDIGSYQDISLAVELHQAGVRKDVSQLDALARGLEHPVDAVQISAAMALGKIGTSRAIRMLNGAKWSHSHSETVGCLIDIALARARSTRASGRARLRWFADLAGYREADLANLLTTDRQLPSDTLDVDLIVLHTAAEIIAEEKAAGRDMSGAISYYHFGRAERMMFDLAGLPERKRIEILVAHVARLKVVDPDDQRIAAMLADIGEPAVPAIADRLGREMKHSTGCIEGTWMLIRILAYIGDESAEPILMQLEKCQNRMIPGEARRALKHLRAGIRFPVGVLE